MSHIEAKAICPVLMVAFDSDKPISVVPKLNT
jgi:hypothetical protein